MKAKTLGELFKSEEIQKIKRDLLIENLYISEFIDCEIYDRDDEMMILVVEAFNRMYISLRSASNDIPDRCWVNADGTVLVARGQNDPFMPTLDGDRWYCGDEIYEVGVWTEEDTEDYTYLPHKYDKETGNHVKRFDHKHMMCIPVVKYFTVTEDTANIIWDRYGDKIRK